MRKTELVNGEYYHIYNRGVDKRIIFSDHEDVERFLLSMTEFNTEEPIGSIYEHSFSKKLGRETSKSSRKPLVDIVAYCLNPNHFHLLLKQVAEGGISEFMKRLGGGYTKYFNNKYERSGVLFQGVFKSVHVDSNEYLLHVSSYVNLNFRVHHLDQLGCETSKSSWEEYMEVICGKKKKGGICVTDPILGQFRNTQDYVRFAENSLRGTLERRGFLDEVTLLE